ncbi:protein OCTOPUS-like [Abrus precatorius]|uniref:Protein OCTOPUS-like n=1 Tax=Abrus precatorius TaxID=3816 RepID=A0A8B8K1A4_ABRPR|nr:protein OCTOPUS-like [Abrus precatorius]
MNPPPQPPQPHRPSTSCHRHPQEHFTGFCPSCLCERLALLDPNNNNNSSSSRKPPTAAAALKAIFRPPSLPELRRTKSFSASKNEPFSGVFEPQRKSCDVRARSTLWNLFNQDNSNNNTLNTKNDEPPRVVQTEPEVHSKTLASSSTTEEELKDKYKEQVEGEAEEEHEEKDEIRVLEEPNVCDVNEIVEEKEEQQEEAVIVVEEEEEEEELKTMKDHIDLDSSQAKKARDFKEIAGSFWSAASVFSKKLQKWRQKQKTKKRRNGTLPVEKPIGRQFRDTQSEIADYGFGRRSCDTDPRFSLDAGRFSLDAGRMSFDDPRYSLEEPRASWDGYLIGRTGFPRMPTMLSVVEDAPVHHVVRTDTQIPVEEPVNEDEYVPGGTAQTREYYSDSSSRRRKSLDRSNSVRKSVSLEVDELKSGVKMGFNDRDLSSNSMREDCCSETFDMSVIGNGNQKGSKKSRRWRWSIWGFIHRRSGNKDEDEDRYSRVNGVERSFSESWQELRGDRGGDGRGGGLNGRVLRSNSSVSWRNSQGIGNGGPFGTFRRNGIQGNGNGKKGKDEFVLERNRSARYSPNNIDNGLLRFYLTPMRGSRRNGSVKSRSNQAHSIARSVLGLY